MLVHKPFSHGYVRRTVRRQTAVPVSTLLPVLLIVGPVVLPCARVFAQETRGPAKPVEPIRATPVRVAAFSTTTLADMLRFHQAHPDVQPTIHPFMPNPGPHDIATASEAIAPSPATGVERDRAVAPARTISPAPLAPPMLTSFPGVVDNFTTIPPDTMGAVGPNHVVELINSGFTVFTKTGAVVSPQISLAAFWSSLGGGFANGSFDPKILYDPGSGRWIAAADTNAFSPASAVLLAISLTNDPTGGWNMFAIDADSSDALWADYPGFGLDTANVYVSNNMFGVSNGFFGTVKFWVIDKASMIAGGPLSVGAILDPTGGFTYQPANSFDSVPAGLNYAINEGWQIGSRRFLRVLRFNGIGAAATLTDLGLIEVNPYSFFQSVAPQPICSSSDGISTNDTRLLNAVVRMDTIYTTHSVADATGKTEVSWYEVDPAVANLSGNGTPNQQGRIADQTMWYYFSSIAVNADKCIALGFSGSSPTTFASAFFTAHLPTDPPGFTPSPGLMQAGSAEYLKTFGGGENRWGDYSATMVDPADDLTFWTLQEYATGSPGSCADNAGKWATWWVSFTCTTAGAGVKFSQPPDAQGEDIASNIDWVDDIPNVVVSDDFISDGRPIDAVRWWGSNLGGTDTAQQGTTMTNKPRNAWFRSVKDRPMDLVQPAAIACQPSPLNDAFGDPTDTLGAGPPLLDIDSMTVSTDGINLSFSITFHTPISAPSGGAPDGVIGNLEFDTDQNAVTGISPLQNTFAPPFTALGLGIDFFVDLFVEQFTPGFVNVVDANSLVIGAIPITYGAQSLSGVIPLSMLGGDDGFVDFTTIIGTIPQPTDALELCGSNGAGATCGDNVVNQASEECDGTDAAACPGQCLSNCTCPLPPAPSPDGWFVSFHPPSDQTTPPSPPLGLYFCDQTVVQANPTALPACDNHPVLQYFVNLADCCLVHAEVDPRSNGTPAQCDGFHEEECFDYELDVQAVIGHKFVTQGCGVCVETPTGRSASADFWGWHSTLNGVVDAQNILGPALKTTVQMVGPDWIYGPWLPIDVTCGQRNMSFELITNTVAPGDPDANGNGVPDVCECPTLDAPQPQRLALPGNPEDVKNRILSIVPGNAGQRIGLKVVFVSLPPPFNALNGKEMWVGAPAEICENSGNGPNVAPNNCGAAPGIPDPTFFASSLQCAPFFTDWSTIGTVHVHHEFIVPNGQYDILAIEESCDPAAPASFSLPLTMTTAQWGDVMGTTLSCPLSPPDGVVGITTDVTAVLDKFSNKPCALTKARADLDPANLDFVINVATDVTLALDAFSSASYPFVPSTTNPCP